MILVIGYGNSLRQDDGAGLILAEIIERELQARQIEVERIAVHQLMPELAKDIARQEVDSVVFVDTRVVVSPDVDPGIQIYPIEKDMSTPVMGHHLDAAALLLYAALLYGHQPPAWQITIPGTTFGHGETLSVTVQNALTTAPAILIDWLPQLVENMQINY